MKLPRTRYDIERSRNNGEYWEKIHYDILTEEMAESCMNKEHERHPSDWLRLVKIDMSSVKEILGNKKTDTQKKYDSDGLMITDKHVFFYKNICPFSNFYPCSFIYTYMDETHRFFSSEQAFMWVKAMFFNDMEAASNILNNGNTSPRYCKDQGRLVKNYDEEKWAKIRQQVFMEVIFNKFAQDKKLRDFILDSRFDGKIFVEASPNDAIWGIHMSIDNENIDDEGSWVGMNLLGHVIDIVRKQLKITRFPKDI